MIKIFVVCQVIKCQELPVSIDKIERGWGVHISGCKHYTGQIDGLPESPSD
jgi:hypothetical protein